MDIAPSRALPVLLQQAEATDQARLAGLAPWIMELGRVESLDVLDAQSPAPDAALARAGGLNVLVPLAGLIDPAAECARLDKAIAKLEKDYKATRGKLDNPNFTERAPAEVVAGARTLADEQEASLTALRAQRERMGQMAAG